MLYLAVCFFFNDTATTEIYTLSLHDALPIFKGGSVITLDGDLGSFPQADVLIEGATIKTVAPQIDAEDGEVIRSEEHTSELQSRQYLVCRLLLEKKIQHVAQALVDAHFDARF